MNYVTVGELHMISRIVNIAMLCIFIVSAHSNLFAAEVNALSNSKSLKESLSSIETWSDRRFKGITRQEYDYSCGAASLATLVNNLYHLSYSEEDILNFADTEGAALTMSDMKTIAESLGYIGFGAKLKTLEKMDFMFIVHLKPYLGDYEHYSVVESVGDNTITLADSAWGRKVFPISKFMEMWLIHEDDDGMKVGYIFGALPPPEQRDLVTNSLKPPRSLIPEHVYRHLSMQSMLYTR